MLLAFAILRHTGSLPPSPPAEKASARQDQAVMRPRKPALDQERPRHLPASNRVKEFSACAPGGGFPLLGGPRALNPARPRSLSQVRHEVKRKDDLRSRPMAIGSETSGGPVN